MEKQIYFERKERHGDVVTIDEQRINTDYVKTVYIENWVDVMKSPRRTLVIETNVKCDRDDYYPFVSVTNFMEFRFSDVSIDIDRELHKLLNALQNENQ